MFSFWPRLAICVSFSCPAVCASSSDLAIAVSCAFRLVHLLIEQRDACPRRIAEPLLLGQQRRDGIEPLLLGRGARGCVLCLLLQRIAQCGERPVLLGQLGEIGQLRRDGLLVRLHRLVEFGDLPLHLGKLRLGRGELAVGVAKLTPRLGKLCGDRRGLLLRRIGAAGRRREILLQPLRPRGARARLQRGVGELLCEPVALRTQRVAVGGRALRLRLQCGKLLRQRFAGRAGRRQLAIELCDRLLQIRAATALQRQHVADLGKLAVHPVELLVASRQRNREEGLRQHEHQQHEDDDHQQRGQRVHVARPGGQSVVAAAAYRQRHG